MIFVKLDESNIEKYIEYLEHALAVEPEQMHVDKIDKEGLRERIKDSFFRKTTSVLAMENAKVLGRIEYHFYGCCLLYTSTFGKAYSSAGISGDPAPGRCGGELYLCPDFLSQRRDRLEGY